MSTTMATAILTSPDISCGHCVASINEAVNELDGVQNVEASEQTKQVVVEFDPQRVSETQIRAALDEAGYPAQP